MLRDLIARAAPAVVKIVCSDIDSVGSGFLVSADGHIVTNSHVVARIAFHGGVANAGYSQTIVAYIGDTEHVVALVSDPDDLLPIVYDYAILQAQGLAPVPYLELGDTASLQQGDDVLCLGFPFDFGSPVATTGIVSAMLSRPSHIATGYQMRSIVSNSVVQSGNSGGPMLHVETGKVVGINTLRHELRDDLTQQLRNWYNHPDVQRIPGLTDVIAHSVHFAYVGLHHAVSVEYVRSDARWPGRSGDVP
jgi:S1-C subfamily serine protease